MNEIKVSCFTNIDEFQRAEWPRTLKHRPLIGERITAKGGINLKIVAIRHDYDGDLILELHRS